MECYYSKSEIMNLINNTSSTSSTSNTTETNDNITSNINNSNSSNSSTKSNSNNSISKLVIKNNNSNTTSFTAKTTPNANEKSSDFILNDTKNPRDNKVSKNSIHNNYKKNNFDNTDNKEENDFSLLKANFYKNSMLQFSQNEREKHISGITIPWFYLGMIFSTFCWHTEDLYLYSLNYMHDGSPKIWYGISPRDKEKMDEYIKSKYYGVLIKQPDLIHRLTVHIDPKELRTNGITVYRVVQNPGDIILTLPKAYHTGFSTGLNMAEAVNLSVINYLII